MEEPVLSLCTVHCDLQPVTSLTPGITAACWRISDTGLELRQLEPIQQGLKRSILFCGLRPNLNQTNPTDGATGRYIILRLKRFAPVPPSLSPLSYSLFNIPSRPPPLSSSPLVSQPPGLLSFLLPGWWLPRADGDNPGPKSPWELPFLLFLDPLPTPIPRHSEGAGYHNFLHFLSIKN